MKKILIYTEHVKKRGAKLQFQIKLPRTCIKVKGILITIHPWSLPKPTKAVRNPSKELGSIWLRIPEKRDVFYTQTCEYPNHIIDNYLGIDRQGLTGNNEWWTIRTKRAFFKIEVPSEDTLIEGFYVDHSTAHSVDYQVKVYLELEINE
ncbi:MAG: hypothetical protein JKY09_03510 [Crocinitomicaceae bacterium]|nr:hypothetical protein [Crocinitomicaceae bacterium]